MPLIKFGKTYYNGEERAIYILQGNATRDGEECPINDKPHAKVSVAAQGREDGSTLFITVNGWRDRAEQIAAIRKLDSVLAIGVLKKREYNGKDYWDMDADFVAISGAGILGADITTAGSYNGFGSSSGPGCFSELESVDDGDLPF